jgi:aryl-alcohol dehydrogenase-like predicted oxidoreductase
MRMKSLGRTGLTVSEFCLGTMTWGRQTSEAEAHEQIGFALDRGINFLDVAEMYPSPPRADSVGRTEEIIGNWFAGTGRREEVVLASKVTGEGSRMVRAGALVTGVSLKEACEGSLRRLRTDRIDLYQLHWPNRGSYHFRKHWSFDASAQDRQQTLDHMHDVLEAAADLIAAGKIGHFGLSNETAWGTAQWLRVSEKAGLPRVPSIQNEYSLLCRYYDTDLAELGVNEDVTLLAYSPLAAGLLTGKYAGRVVPSGTRMEASADLGGRVTPAVWGAVSAYLGIATRHGLDPAQMALAFIKDRPFPVIPILGATSVAQLAVNVDAAGLALAPEVLREIAAARREHAMPF